MNTNWIQESKLPFGPALAVIEFTSVARGTSNIHGLVLQNQELHVLETYPCASGRFVALINGEFSSLHESAQKLVRALNESDIHDFAIWESFPFEIVKALYGLNAATASGASNYVVETSSLSSLLEFSKIAFLEAGAKPIDMRGPRGTTGGCYATFSGEEAPLKKALRLVEESPRQPQLIAHVVY